MKYEDRTEQDKRGHPMPQARGQTMPIYVPRSPGGPFNSNGQVIPVAMAMTIVNPRGSGICTMTPSCVGARRISDTLSGKNGQRSE